MNDDSSISDTYDGYNSYDFDDYDLMNFEYDGYITL